MMAGVRCNQGLEPVEPGTAVSAVAGTIRYRNWPPPDSLLDLRIVAFREFPPGNIVASVLSGQAAVYPPLGDTSLVPFYVDSVRYGFALDPGTYEYVTVVQQFGQNLFTDWRAVGQYDLDTNLEVPSPILVPAADTLRDVNISVDFSHPPPPPF
jgi:hypothetical protein